MPSVNIFNEQNSYLNNLLVQLRDVEEQGDAFRFRQNLRKIGWAMAFEMSKTFNYAHKEVQTPLGKAVESVMNEDVVVVSIMRAAQPLGEGFVDVFSEAKIGFIGAMRQEGDEINVDLSYVAIPEVEGKRVIIADPMLATGKSLVEAVGSLLQKGEPESLDIATVISAPEGIDYLEDQLNCPYQLWTAAVDSHLNEKSYIVPGLGDAGDLSFGEKI